MLDCREQIYSEDYYDFIVPYGEVANFINMSGGCSQPVAEGYDIFFFPKTGVNKFDITNVTYLGIPKCYGLLDRTAVEASGITRLQDQPSLALKGNGVLVGFVDTGIDYTNPLFRYSNGDSRIFRIWDQTIREGPAPENFIYGAEYTTEDINRALASDDPYEIVPSRDEDGHGTFLAGVACGGEEIQNDFTGAAPQAKIAVVKLKGAKQYLRDFFFIPDGELAFQQTDIMTAVAYLDHIAYMNNMPLVLCIAIGNNMGSHGLDGVLTTYLNYICTRRKRAVVVASGNEANARHHYQGQIVQDMEYEDVEISVEDDMPGLFVELWADSPELYAVSVLSPTGEQVPMIPVRAGVSSEHKFVFEGTRITIDYVIDAKEANLLIFFRFESMKRGLWTIRVYPRNTVTGRFNMWLPLQRFTAGNAIFLRSNPDVTLTSPSSAARVITVGGYNHANGSIFSDSGRGYTTTGDIKPDFVAPAVNVSGPGLCGSYITITGTSAAAAITAGACAQVLEWAIVQENQPLLSNAGVKNLLIRGANQPAGRIFPNREWGYGTLDVYRSFEQLRE